MARRIHRDFRWTLNILHFPVDSSTYIFNFPAATKDFPFERRNFQEKSTFKFESLMRPRSLKIFTLIRICFRRKLFGFNYSRSLANVQILPRHKSQIKVKAKTRSYTFSFSRIPARHKIFNFDPARGHFVAINSPNSSHNQRLNREEAKSFPRIMSRGFQLWFLLSTRERNFVCQEKFLCKVSDGIKLQ